MADGVYYVVLADLVGSTDYMKRMGNAAGVARFNAFSRAAKEALIDSKPKNSGEFIKDAGDAVLLVFRYFPDIVEWRLKFDGSLNFAWPHDERLAARLWVHAGEVSFRTGDAHGLAVSQIFKIEAKSKRNIQEGQLVLTHAAREIADPALFPKQCELVLCGKVQLADHPQIKLFELIVKADIAFLIDKQRNDKTRAL